MKSRSLDSSFILRQLLAVALPMIAAVSLQAGTINVISLADGGPGSLRQALIDAGNGGTITFDPILSNKSIVLTNGELVVSNSVTINGLGASMLAISGTTTSRVFHVTNSSTVLINALTLDAGSPVADNGGAVVNEAGSTLTIDNSMLTNNAGINGGAIYNLGSLTIQNCLLANNSATMGGAIYSLGSLAVYYTTVTSNSATGNGGGIVSLATATISNSVISANAAALGSGGAIYDSNSVLTVSMSQLTGNAATNGGALYNDLGGTVLLVASSASSNTASSAGGLGGGIANFSSLTVSNSGVRANSGASGGGIYSKNGVVTLVQSGVTSNQAAAGGGLFNDLNSTATVTKVHIDGNSAATGDGGGINSFGPLTILDSTISTNLANNYGGGISINNSTLVISNSTLIANQASDAGGGAHLDHSAGTVSDCLVNQNSASIIGGLANIVGSLLVENSTISSNSGDFGGGIGNTGTLTVNQSTIESNAGFEGGGIYNNFGMVAVVRSTIDNNFATAGNGGGIDNMFGPISVVLSTISGNSAGQWGGGIYTTNAPPLTISESTLSGNQAPQGGALYAGTGSVTVDNTIFANSSAGLNIVINGPPNFTSLGHNLSDDTSADALLTQPTDLNETGAGLDPSGLEFNGGPTETIALEPGSAAISAGGPLFAPDVLTIPSVGSVPVYPPFTDQRGFPRFACGQMDIGAFEYNTNTAPIIAFALNGPATLTFNCPSMVVDPGAVASNLCGGALAISGGGTHSLALRSDGSVVGWGDDSSGQTNVPAGLESIGVAAGGAFSLALQSDGSVAGWGSNSNGQLGITNAAENMNAIAAGGFHSLALMTNGTVVGSGDNTYGQSTTPTNENVVAISAGRYHSLGLLSDGTVIGWGAGSFTASPEDGINYSQTVIPAGLSNVVAVAAGGYHSLALLGNGTVVAWGAGVSNVSVFVDFGQSQVPGDLGNVIAIAAGGYHSLALQANGTVVAWGNDIYGQSSGATNISDAVAVAAGTYHSLAILGDGTVAGWGLDSNGQTMATIDLAADLSSNITTSDSGTTNGIGAFVRTYTLVDAQGVTHTLTRTFIVNSTNGPAISAMNNITQPNDFNVCGALVFYTLPTATDSCGSPLTVKLTAGLLSGAQFPVGTTVVTYTATDASGNQVSTSFNVTVQDVQPPSLTVANISTTTAPGSCSSAPITFSPTVSDNCTGAVTVAYFGQGETVITNGVTTFPQGTNAVIAIATDVAGNTTTGSFTVTVIDLELPVLTCPGNITTNAQSAAGTVVTFTTSVSDNCTGVTVAAAAGSLNSGATFPIGNSIVARVATDLSGNQAFCQFTITVVGPQDMLLAVQSDMLTLRDQVTEQDGGKTLDKALTAISLANSAVFDETQVTYAQGPVFFKSIEKVEQSLHSLLHSKQAVAIDGPVQDLYNRVATAVRVLTEIEINNAVQANASAKAIAKANQELARGQALEASGNLTGAVNSFRSAWQSAAAALIKTY